MGILMLLSAAVLLVALFELTAVERGAGWRGADSREAIGETYRGRGITP